MLAGGVAGGKNFCFRLLRDTSVLVLGLPSTNAKSEYAYLRKNIGGAGADSFCAHQGFQGGTPWRPSSATSWDAPRSGIQTGTARRVSSTRVKRKSCLISPQISPKKTSFCPFCRLTYIILYAIIHLARFFLQIHKFRNDIREDRCPARRGRHTPQCRRGAR